jgi:hypothetical protein
MAISTGLTAKEAKTRQGRIHYLSPDPMYETVKPYFMNIPMGEDIGHTNVVHTGRDVALTDLRGMEDQFRLDQSGFQIENCVTSLAYEEFAKAEIVTSKFFAEVQALLMQKTGAAEVIPFDYQVRRRDPALPVNSRGAPGKAQPFGAVHAGTSHGQLPPSLTDQLPDQTARSAMRRFHYFHPEAAEKYRGHRIQIVKLRLPLPSMVPLLTMLQHLEAFEGPSLRCSSCDLRLPKH